MVETRTLWLYNRARRRMSVFRHLANYRGFWTARTAGLTARTRSRSCNNPKSAYFPISYLPWTRRTAISGFFMMRVCARVITLELVLYFSSFSRHVKLRNCCPFCPSIDFIKENRLLPVLLHVHLFSISVLAVQNRLRSIVSLVKVAFPTGLESENRISRSQIASVGPNVLETCIPLGLGTVPVSFPVRGGTTPEKRQSNRSKNWVVRVVRVDARLSQVNAHG